MFTPGLFDYLAQIAIELTADKLYLRLFWAQHINNINSHDKCSKKHLAWIISHTLYCQLNNQLILQFNTMYGAVQCFETLLDSAAIFYCSFGKHNYLVYCTLDFGAVYCWTTTKSHSLPLVQTFLSDNLKYCVFE